jgi:XTP/dITP diphosphohydrolase
LDPNIYKCRKGLTLAQDNPLVLATGNKGKIIEIKNMLSPFPVKIMSLKDFGPIPPVVEDGETFEENAYKKAHFTAKVLGFPALADDSGLMVEALRGEPGVRSARYAGEGATDKERNLKLIRVMEGVKDRKAVFICVIAIAVPRGPALIYEGKCEGLIAYKTKGEKGFGYDPLFYYPPLKKTFGQMAMDEKNMISHRGKALAEVGAEFQKIMAWINQRLAEESM